jgi:hypothetical protein
VLPAERWLRLLLGGVAFAAGLTGVVLLLFPDTTDRYFSWGLGPPPLTTLIGGSYVASIFVFGWAVRRPWVETRGLVVGTLALTLPMLAVTFTHLDQFDFSRWQAWAWVALFLASPLSFGSVIVLRRGIPVDAGPMSPRAHRAVAAVLVLGLGALALALWVDPVATGRILPFDLPPLGGRVLGCWCSFLAFLAGWAAVRSHREGRLSFLALAAFAAGALIGGLRSFGDLGPPSQRTAYVAVLVGIALVATWAARPSPVRGD